MSSKIKSIQGLQILDSRGNPTVAVEVILDDGSKGMFSVPSGASTGEFEAVELRDGDNTKFNGKGVLKAVAAVNNTIAPRLIGTDACEQSAVDGMMLELDGTRNKSKLGANAILGVSLAVARAAAASRKQGLYEYLSGGRGNLLPMPLVNVINGGAHANNSLDIQEFMLVPVAAPAFSEAIRISSEIFHALGKLLKDDGYSTAVGDEGGYAAQIESADRAFELLLGAIERAGYSPGKEVSFALDVAASELAVEGTNPTMYEFKKAKSAQMTSAEIIATYESWCKKYPIVSIEDGLDENDWDGWVALTKSLGSTVQLVGDDLFVTNQERIKRGIDMHVGNSVLVKVNQIGSLTETMQAIETSQKASYTYIISHRSGETEDSTIADIAVATNAGQIKTGSMSRGERLAKYNRLLWIENKLGSAARFENPFK
jgi:enolase